MLNEVFVMPGWSAVAVTPVPASRRREMFICDNFVLKSAMSTAAAVVRATAPPWR
jgi:hypothetical protein